MDEDNHIRTLAWIENRLSSIEDEIGEHQEAIANLRREVQDLEDRRTEIMEEQPDLLFEGTEEWGPDRNYEAGLMHAAGYHD